MPSNTQITVPQLSRLIGLPTAPAIIDVRTKDDFEADPRLLPTAQRRDFRTVGDWAEALIGRQAVVVCRAGLKLSEGVAAWLRHKGIPAESLEGGFDAWKAAGNPLVTAGKLPPPNEAGQMVWVTRARPKVDRIACPWLIRRFVDPDAVFLFVAASEVLMVAERFDATPFDVDGVFWSHRGERCSFDTMIEEFGPITWTHQSWLAFVLISRGSPRRTPRVCRDASSTAAWNSGPCGPEAWSSAALACRISRRAAAA